MKFVLLAFIGNSQIRLCVWQCATYHSQVVARKTKGEEIQGYNRDINAMIFYIESMFRKADWHETCLQFKQCIVTVVYFLIPVIFVYYIFKCIDFFLTDIYFYLVSSYSTLLYFHLNPALCPSV